MKSVLTLIKGLKSVLDLKQYRLKMAEGENKKKRKRPIFQKKIKKSTIADQTIAKLQLDYNHVRKIMKH